MKAPDNSAVTAPINVMAVVGYDSPLMPAFIPPWSASHAI